MLPHRRKQILYRQHITRIITRLVKSLRHPGKMENPVNTPNRTPKSLHVAKTAPYNLYPIRQSTRITLRAKINPHPLILCGKIAQQSSANKTG